MNGRRSWSPFLPTDTEQSFCAESVHGAIALSGVAVLVDETVSMSRVTSFRVASDRQLLGCVHQRQLILAVRGSTQRFLVKDPQWIQRGAGLR
jgi:hypothetical protein